ncbi:glycosyl hydrolase family 18 protein [Belliella aquatica]|nr:glycosyl hydrolase family 18 protein [Belliella aquatica]MCH7406324.1 glycosyl hydrolase family 18 protein [Belliella aquatica]
MKKISYNLVFVFFLLSLTLFSCRREYSKLKSSTRRVSSEMRYLERTSGGLIAALGLGDQSEGLDTAKTQMTPLIQKSFIQDYAFLYDGLNGEKTNNYLQSFEYDSSKNVFKRQDLFQKKLRENVEVYTWYPYWMGDVWKSYNFDLISTISFFSYKIDPQTGSYLNPVQISQWRETALIDSAKQHGTKVLLNLALEGENNLNEYLKNEASWNTTLDSIAVLIRERDADGIEIEFFNVPEGSAGKFLDFVSFIKDNLDYRFIAKKMLVSLILPTQPDNFFAEIEDLDEYIDLFIIKGLDYHELVENGTAVAPLRTDVADGLSLENSIGQYLKMGLVAEKSILALPLYGSQWSGTWDRAGGFYETDFERKITLSEVSRVFESRDTSYVISPVLDEVSMTNYFFLEFEDDSSVECWYDDSYTLAKKIDLALFKNFKGVGFWALGYDLGSTDIWDVVEEKFTGNTVYVQDPIAEMEGYPIQVASFIQKYEKLFVVTFVMLTIIIFFTLALAFSDWRFRDTILARQLYRIIFLFGFIFITLSIATYFGILGQGNWTYFLLFFLGAAASYYIEKYGGLIKINKP